MVQREAVGVEPLDGSVEAGMHTTEEPKSVLQIVRENLGEWNEGALAWSGRSEGMEQVSISPFPKDEIQLLRVLVALVTYFPERVKTGFLIEEIVVAGLALFPGSRFFLWGTDIVSIPSAKWVEAKVVSLSRDGLSATGKILRRCESVGRPKGRRQHGPRPRRTLVVLTAVGAEVAFRGGWLPPSSSEFCAQAHAAERAISFGKISLK